MKSWTHASLETLSRINTFNVGERNLILRLRKMLTQVDDGKVLDEEDFNYLKHKMFVRSFCFEERYGGIYRHLKRHYESSLSKS